MVIFRRQNHPATRRHPRLNLWLLHFSFVDKAQVVFLILRIPLPRPQAHVESWLLLLRAKVVELAQVFGLRGEHHRREEVATFVSIWEPLRKLVILGQIYPLNLTGSARYILVLQDSSLSGLKVLTGLLVLVRLVQPFISSKTLGLCLRPFLDKTLGLCFKIRNL